MKGAEIAKSKPKDELKVPDPAFSYPMLFLGFMCFVPHALFLWHKYETTKDKENPFGETPWYEPVSLAVGYLAMLYLGPLAMAGRNSFQIKEIMVAYNVYQVILNAVMVAGLWHGALNDGQPLWGKVLDFGPKGHPIAFFVWMHYNDKFVEYLDSLFFIMRRNFFLLTGLHCWHHLIMGPVWWCVIAHAAGGDAWYGSMWNSFIHVVMYAYYALKIVKSPIASSMQMWVTVLQLVQFCAVAAQSAYLLYREHALGIPSYPTWLTILQLLVMMNMFVMFMQYFAGRYCGGKKKSSKGKKGTDQAAIHGGKKTQ